MEIEITEKPPVCGICDRKVREVFIKTIGPTKEYPYCKDCFFAWYDGAGITKKAVKKAVLKEKGKRGGEANLKGKPR